MSSAVHWFRKGLRLHDNPALLRTLEDKCELMLSSIALNPCLNPGTTPTTHSPRHVYPVFVLDPHFAKAAYVGVLRYNFLLQVCRLPFSPLSLPALRPRPARVAVKDDTFDVFPAATPTKKEKAVESPTLS